MSKYLRIALRIYKWAAMLFLIAYIIYIIYDDYVLIQKISSLAELGTFMTVQCLYLIVYSLEFSFCYWLASILIILGYITIRKLGKVKKRSIDEHAS